MFLSGRTNWTQSQEEDGAPDKEKIKNIVVQGGFDLDKMDGLKQYYAALKAASGFQAIDEPNKLIVDIIVL